MSSSWLSAKEATKLLRVNRATLYAYVSRGYIRSVAGPGTSREKHYAREDVERLRRRAEERRNPERAAHQALHWGLPILESSITLIADGKLFYRGRDVADLAHTRSVEDVASLLWTGVFESHIFDTPLHVISGGAASHDLPFISRAQSILPLVAARDPLAFDLRPRAIARTGWRIVNLLTSVAAETRELEASVEQTLAKAWAPRSARAAEVIRAALIVCADHELNVSAFTARCIASAASSPYAAVLGGLAALEGAKHGGETARIEALYGELRRARDLRKSLADRLRRGDRIEGCGHPLYPGGDPRASLLFDLLDDRFPKSKELAFAHALAAAAQRVLGEKPAVDFALVAVSRVLALPPGSALALFAIGRTIGWIAHAMEQYAQNAIIRPRARYVGEKPAGP